MAFSRLTLDLRTADENAEQIHFELRLHLREAYSPDILVTGEIPAVPGELSGATRARARREAIQRCHLLIAHLQSDPIDGPPSLLIEQVPALAGGPAVAAPARLHHGTGADGAAAVF